MFGKNESLREAELQLQASMRRTAMQKEGLGVETARGVTRTERIDTITPTAIVQLTSQQNFEHTGINGHNKKNGHNGKNGSKAESNESISRGERPKEGDQEQDEDLDTDLEALLTLSQLADSIGIAQQHIVNLVTRFDLISPQKSADFTSRETYIFTQEEAAKARQVFELRDVRGKPMREAVEIVRNSPIYNKSARELQSALMSYGGDRESVADIIDSILQSPRFIEEERHVLMLIEGHGKSILETGAELGMKSEREVITVLNSGYQKVGETLFDLLHIALDK